MKCAEARGLTGSAQPVEINDKCLHYSSDTHAVAPQAAHH